MQSNIHKLGTTLANRMQKTANAAVKITMEMGVINKNMSLSTDSLQTAIPKGEYMVAIHLASGSYNTSSASTDGGSHNHRLPDVFRGLKPGDRVLVAWCGYEPVVISVIVSS